MEDDSGLSIQSKWLSYVMISIWLVLTLIVVIVVLSNNPNYAKALELIVQVVSALGGAAAGIAGFLAVKAARDTLAQARADRRAELELKRPQFSAFGGVMGTQYTETRENDDYINLQFVNEGGRPAKDVRVTAFLMDEQLETEQVIRHTEANNVSVNNSFLFSRRGIKLGEFNL
jgi:hypothetical protein